MRLHLLLLYRSTKMCKSCVRLTLYPISAHVIYFQLFMEVTPVDKTILSPLRLPVPPSRPLFTYSFPRQFTSLNLSSTLMTLFQYKMSLKGGFDSNTR